ncbi:MAG: LamG domain-containing protein [Phycisphaerae bacterium]|nr:LamG domain-containing protein [Phycisphaerae bacterium]
MRILSGQGSNIKNKGTTLVELVVAISMMVVIMGTVLPLLSCVRQTWDTYDSNAETLQNGRILLNHLSQYLAVAASIESVSNSADALGYIQFKDYENTTHRYAVNDSGYVEYGQLDSMYEIAGPVSQLKFTCYDGNNPSSPVTDANDIRLIHIDVACVSSSELGPDMTFATAVFINADPVSTVSDFEGWWRLDDASGTTARDSSGKGRHGTLMNMTGDEWTTGVIGGALTFNGSTDYVDLPIGQVIETTTDLTIAAWVNWSGLGDTYQRVFDFGSGTTDYMLLTPETGDGGMRFAITDGGWSHEDQIMTIEPLGTGWHHVAVTIDDANEIHTLYVDGEVVGQNTDAKTNPSDLGETTHNWLGRSQFSADPYFDGTLDDVRLYTRALSAQEISDLVSDASMVLFKDFEEAKSDGSAQSLTIPTPGYAGSVAQVYVLGTWSTGLTHVKPAGKNRLLLFTAHAEDYDNDIKIESVTYGGQPMTKIKDKRSKKEKEGNLAARDYVVTFYLDESGIANASSSVFSPTWNDTPASVNYTSAFLGNVKQADPIGDSESTEDKRNSTVSTKALSTSMGDMAFVAATAGNEGWYFVNNGFTEGIELSMTSADGVMGYMSADGNDVTPSVTHLYTTYRQAVIGFVVQVGSVPLTTIEGDLLIAAVVTGGTTTVSEPQGQGWSLLSQGEGNGKITLGVWGKLAGASESGSHTFTWTDNEEAYGWIMRFTGFDPSCPIDVMDTLGGSSTRYPPSPSVTTTVDHTMILRIGGFDKDSATIDDTGISGYTTITMDSNGGGKGAVSGGAAYIHQLEIGSSGTLNFELRNPEQYRTVTLAIAPSRSDTGQ